MSFKYKTIFASKITKISNPEMETYLSTASLEKLKSLMPKNVDLDKNPDLIGLVANAAVSGKKNLNGDSIANKDAVAIAKNFVWKFVDIEHKHLLVKGVICNYGFSKFGTNEIMTEEEVLKSEEPVNISLAFLLWKMTLNDDFIELLEECTDETSSSYGGLSLSWELLFNNYDIAVGSSEVSKARIVTDEKEKSELKPHLKCKGGAGRNEEGFIYRVVALKDKDDFLIPSGVGIVEDPAGNVKGLYVVENNEKEEKEKAESSINVNEKLATVDATFAVSASDLANAIQRVGSSAQDAGVSLDELIAIISLAQQTTNRGGDIIGNSLKTIFTRIQRAEVLDQLQSLGVSAKDLEGNPLPAAKIFGNLARTYNELKEPQKSQICELIGGVLQANILKQMFGGEVLGLKDEALNKISQDSKNLSVTNDTRIQYMKIKSIKDITNEMLKTADASVIHDFLEDSIRQANESWKEEKGKLDKNIEDTKALASKAEADRVKAEEILQKTQEKLQAIEASIAEKQQQEAFNLRMEALNKDYSLNSDENKEFRAIIAKEIFGLSDEDYKVWGEKAKVLYKEKSVAYKQEIENKLAEAQAKVKPEEKKKEEIKASVNEEEKKETEKALENAEQSKAALPNSSSPAKQTMKEKYAKAFAEDQIEIVSRKR
jgi:hypothetical protein